MDSGQLLLRAITVTTTATITAPSVLDSNMPFEQIPFPKLVYHNMINEKSFCVLTWFSL